MNFQDAIDQLPEFSPRPSLWNHIAKELDREAVLDRAMLQLPEWEPDPKSWRAIEGRLCGDERPFLQDLVFHPRKDARIRPIWRRSALRVASAAALGGLAGAWLYLSQPTRQTMTVAYSVEVSQPVPLKNAVPLTDLRPLIARRCREVETLCEKPEIKELQHELADLDSRQTALAEQLAVFGNDPKLVEAQARLQSQREEVTKELIILLAI